MQEIIFFYGPQVPQPKIHMNIWNLGRMFNSRFFVRPILKPTSMGTYFQGKECTAEHQLFGPRLRRKIVPRSA